MNFWGNAMIKGTHLYMLLTRIRNPNGTWGAFTIRPYWSVVDNKNTIYSTSQPIGPIGSRPSRINLVPSKEYSYKDISGRDALGHIFNVGDTRYPMGDIRFNAKPEVPVSTKAISIGVQYATANDKNPIYNTVRRSYTEKQKLPMIDVYINM
jgi:hypothetical protein